MNGRLGLQLVWLGAKIAIILALDDTVTNLVIYQKF
jgi:hypothetical protein